MDQNYSYNRKFTDEEYIIDLPYFLQKMQYVKKMFISDIQSGFLQILTNDDIFPFIQEHGIFIIGCNKAKCKLISEVRENKELFIGKYL